MRLRLLTIATLLTLTAIATTASVQQPQPTSLSGFIMDMIGGVIPGATVTLSTSSTAAFAKTVTNTKGAYSFSALPTGIYDVDFSLSGFRTVTCKDITVREGDQAVVTTFLSIGEIPEALRDYAAPASDRPTPERQQTPIVESPKPAQTCLRAGEVPVHMQMFGEFSAILALDTVKAPATSANFLKYVIANAYEHGTLARVDLPVIRSTSGAPPRDAATSRSVIAGSISQRYSGQLLAPIPIETTTITGLRHKAGTISMRRDDGTDTTTSTFMVLLEDDPSLDAGGRRYTDGKGAAAFGRVVFGMDGFRGLSSTPAIIASTTIPEPYKRPPH